MMLSTIPSTVLDLMLCSWKGTVCNQALCSVPVGWLSSTATAVRFMMSRHCLQYEATLHVGTQAQST